MLVIYSAVFFIAFTSGSVPKRPAYLTSGDFARGKELPSVLPNGTILNLPQNELLNVVSSSARNSFVDILNLKQKKRQKRNTFECKKPWPNARVPFTLDPKFDDKQRAEVARAFENFHSKTCVRFATKHPMDNEFVQILRDDRVCGVAQNCRRAGAQYAKFGGNCITAGVITHELLHTLCFHHEQSRPDRDQYISWNKKAKNCVPDEVMDANDFTSFDLLYDYVSIQHSEAECYNGCMKPKLSGVTKCGSGGDLSVLDAEKINALYNCGGCHSYRFKPFSLITANENLIWSGYDFNGDEIYICRGYYNGDIVVGNGIPKIRSCRISYNGREHTLTENFEFLTNPGNAEITWGENPKDGSVPANAIRGGRSAERETLYIGRAEVNYNGKTTVVVGKIHKSANSTAMYFPCVGREYTTEDYEFLICNPEQT